MLCEATMVSEIHVLDGSPFSPNSRVRGCEPFLQSLVPGREACSKPWFEGLTLLSALSARVCPGER